ncbi:heme-binding domain-containing protein [uncultured Zobellia sp.]|uniref:heme-binding domain-containing protein n=1 Tax=uncultured Zobellia sp. TaxID=255433 RepID=UPI0025987C22|nr:heme-binding domain-containing protein [uncultured Zobellia sp.]
MKVLKIIALIALIAFVVIQFFPMDYNNSEAVPQTDFMLVNIVPATVEKSLQVSCYDCHSNNTKYPWYNKVQPVAWFLEDHIKEGKAELNFNEWDTYSDRRQNSKLSSIIKQIENGEMPLDSYTLVHRDAIFSEKEKEAVLNYMKTLKDDLE